MPFPSDIYENFDFTLQKMYPELFLQDNKG